MVSIVEYFLNYLNKHTLTDPEKVLEDEPDREKIFEDDTDPEKILEDEAEF